MKIHYSLDDFNARNPVVTIGTFDGLHKGHQSVIEELKFLAREMNGETVIFTFYPTHELLLRQMIKAYVC
nr:adenylyltransferase/cytidyltransferase family protein [Draconibacterium halophilum]